ncbi:MAG: DNA repair protein RecN [Clostridia bacterium]|nr:DNA repair protein RecN [Clostridia bacterium]
MLSSLHIENVALIKETTLIFGEGFTVLTGETGAGKSIIIDAISLLCGGRSDKELIRSGESYAFVEGCFEDFDEETLVKLEELDVHPDEDGALYLSRRVAADGRSSAKIGDRQVPSSRLRAVAELLINIHGQQDTLLLADSNRHLPLIDSYAGNADVLAIYIRRYKTYTELCARLEELKERVANAAFRKEMIEYKLQGLQNAQLKAGEEERLLAERLRLRSAEKISAAATEAYGQLYGENLSADERLYAAINALDRIKDALPEGTELLERLESVKCEIDDIADTLRSAAETDADSAAEKLDKVESRLETISVLKRRFNTDFEGLLTARDDLVKELEEIESGDTLIEDLEEEKRVAYDSLADAASHLSAGRKAAAARLEVELAACLAELDMPSVTIKAQILPKAPAVDGCDEAELLISANAGETPKPLSKIASGGELARIMLAFKTVTADAAPTGTMVFDEIDTGISGKTAQKTGVALKKLSYKGTQVFCVTHSAQIAALANTHLLVRKRSEEGRTQSRVKALDKEGRVDEIARIIGGIDVGVAAREAAAELLSQAEKL